MEVTDESDGKREAIANLGAVDEARSAALKSAKSPMWLKLTLPLVMGAAFGFGTLGGVLGWAVFWVLLTVIVVLVIIDARRVRRRGRIVDGRSMAWQFLWIISFSVVLALLGSVTLPAQQQPWFALAAGGLIAVLTYAFLRWDEALMSKRLASGDFDPYTLF